MKTLDEYDFPSDLKSLDTNANGFANVGDLEDVARQIREFLIEKIAAVGGHFGPNLGIIELSIALHSVFNSPIDKIVWDVSHQSLPHKILTGRFSELKKFHEDGGASAFTNPNESEHDFFINGHTSTSISQALGIAYARDFKLKVQGQQASNDVTNNVIAVIGDGALSGGQAFESLNNAANLKSNFIIIVNDNQMSIDFNSGGLYQGLAELRKTNGASPNNIFRFLGLDYKYVADGNDIKALLVALNEVKDIDHPIVLHINTIKGKGYEIAEKSPEEWHYHIPFDVETGKPTVHQDEKRALLTNKTQETIDFLEHEADSLIIVPGSPLLGYHLQKTVPDRYIDTGIAEQTGVSLGGSIARSGVKTYMVIASSFLQRAYDQIIHDWTLNASSESKKTGEVSTNATLIVLGCGVTSTDATHNGIFDIPMLSNIPNLVYLCPSNDNEYMMMLQWCKTQPFPTAIRLPAGIIDGQELEDRTPSAIECGFTNDISATEVISHTSNGGITPKKKLAVKSEVLQSGENVAIIGVGIWLQKAQIVANMLYDDFCIQATVINARFVSHIDQELLNSLKHSHRLVVTIEDGITEGGYGSKVATYYAADDMKTLVYGVGKEYLDSIKFSSILERYRLDEALIYDDIVNSLGLEKGKQ